jgi:predicted amidophosphoribosyltransferase
VGYARNRELGDCCGFCVRCGWGRRFMLGAGGALPTACPDCGGDVLTACPDCGEPIASLMAITCSGCGRELRPKHLFGVEIRRKPERHASTTACGAPVETREGVRR